MSEQIVYICPKNEEHNDFETEGESTTLMAWFPRFDRFGRPLNTDPNTIRSTYRCLECGSVIRKTREGWFAYHEDAETGKEFLKQDLTPDYLKEANHGNKRAD